MKSSKLGWTLAVTAMLAVTGIVTAQIASDSWKAAAGLPKGKDGKNVQIKVQSKNNRELLIKYRVPDPVIKEIVESSGGKLTQIQLGNAPLRGKKGEPILPIIPVQFVIPYDCEIASIVISNEKKTSLTLTSSIGYGSTPIPLMKGAKVEKAVPKASIYESSSGFPEKSNELVSVQNKRGVKIGIVNFHPVTYFPKANKLEICKEFDITVTFKGSKRSERKPLRLRSTKSELQRLGVENPEMLQQYQDSSVKETVPQSLNKQLLDASESFQYVVITNEAMRDAKTDVSINDLITYRQSLGLTTKLVTIESIFTSYTGVDNAEKLRNFIIDAYTNWETEYVVLGGDLNIIPTRDLYVADDGGSVIQSDFYYQCLDGSFNSDEDSYWGEPNDGENGGDIDLFAEINVGRISAETPEEMSNAVYKILAYERDDESAEYLRTSCMVGEELGSQFGPGEFGFAHPLMNEIKNGSSASGYSTVGFKTNAALTVDSLDDFDEQWPVESMITLINSNKYSVLNHLGHANTDYVMKMYNSQADNLNNTKFMFVFSQGCFPGDLKGDCIAEHLTTSTRNGLFAGVFNSNYGWGAYNDAYETLDGPSQRIDRQFWDAYFSEFIYNLGAINTDSHEDNVWDINGELIRWCIYETNLFGDPYTVLRGQTKGPKVVFKSSTVNDQQGGNGDKIINPGEQVAIGLSLRNIGNEVASGVSASIAISDPYISIANRNLSFGNMPCCGVIVASSNSATIAVAANCPTPYSFPITVEINDNNGNSWVETFTLVAHSTYTISGRVITITGSNPLPGAVIKVTGPVNGEVTTNAAGEYHFAAFDGEYSVHAEAAGYQTSVAVAVTLPPNAQNIDFQMGRSQMVLDPVSIQHTLQVNDSVTIPVQITNTGDVDLLVTAQCKNVSVALGKRAPKLIQGDTAHQNKETYVNDAANKEIKKITSSKQVVRRKVPIGNTQKLLYLNTILYDNTPDQFAEGLTNIANVEKVDLLYGCDATPDLAYLMQYDVVVVASSSAWANAELLGNTLADYVDAGGSLCLLVASIANTGDYGLKGRIITPEYLPLQMGEPGDYSSATTFISHEITKNVASLETEIPITTASLQGDGASLGTYSTGYLVGAYNRTKPVVAINVFPQDYYWGGDLITMMGNTIEWFVQSKWMTISHVNEQLVVTPGSSVEIAVALKSVNMFGGLYNGAIELVHNDPQQGNPLVVPVELTIDGFKSLSAMPQSINFGNLWHGLKDTINLTLTNSGTQKTIVNAITSDNTLYSVNAQLPLSILAGRTTTVAVVYAPSNLGHSSATITVASDAEDNPSILIGTSANCTAGPKAVLAPVTMSFDLGPRDNPADQTAVLSNAGGDVLSYHSVIRQKSKPAFDIVAKRTHAPARKMESLIYNPYNYKHEFALDRVIVAFNEGKSDLANKALLTTLGNGKVRELGVARIPKKGIRAYNGKKLVLIPLANSSRDGVLEAIKLLRQDINVAYVEPDYTVKAIGVPNDPLFSQQYALNNSGQTGGTADADIDAIEGWDVFTGQNSDVILAIIDTGIDYLHPDLAGNIWTNKGEIPDNGIDDDLNGYIDDVYGYDFAYDDNDPMDVYGHGTHCSGIAAARGNDGTGVCGVSYGARLMAAKFLDDDGSGSTSDAIDALAYAYAMGATMSSNSWGGGGYEQSLYDMIAATGLFIAAAGNDGMNADLNPMYPAGYDLDNIISVAATDHNDSIAYFSNYGATTVDLAAPGVNILSCLPGNNHEAWSGTSMATPHVSGCAVLLKTYNPILTSAELKAALLNGLDLIPALEGKTVTGGRLNVQKALESVAPPWLSITPSTAGNLAINAEQQFTVTANPQGLVAGTWVAEVVFKTDDPFKNDHIITVTANISPCRSLRATTESVNFGTLWVSRDTVANLTLVNECNAPVTVSSYVFNNQSFTSEQILPFKVAPFGTFNLPVKYKPSAAGSCDGNIVLTSDAEDNPSLTVPVLGQAVMPPNITINPVSINKTLAYGATQSVPVTLTNSGGADFLYKVETVKPPKSTNTARKLSLSDATVFVSLSDDTIRQLNIETGEYIGKPIIKPYHAWASEGMAYNGEFIYYTNESSAIMVIDPESGKVVDTVNCDIGEAGIDGLGVTDDYLVLGDSWYQKVYVCDKETGALVTSWNSDGYGGGLGCSQSRQSVFVNNFYNGQIEERSLLDGVLLNAITLNNYSVFGIGYSETANLLIASDPYQGIAALNPDNGDFVASYPIYHIWAIAADEGIGNLKWLQSDTKEGVVPAGGSVTFNALLNSTNMLAGTYTANIQVQHRLPILPGPYDISCNLTVLEEKRCAASPSSISFTETWIGRTDTLNMYLVNSGNAATTVKSIVSNNKLFQSFSSAPVIIPASDSVLISVGFTPKNAGTASGTLTVTSDAAKSPVVKIALQGTSLKPPKINCNPNSFREILLPGKTQQEIINLKNTGGADYPFKVRIEPVEDGSSTTGKGQLFGLSDNGLFEMDPTTGAILSVRSSMPMLSLSAFDGTYLYMDSEFSTTIQVIDPSDGTIVRTMNVQQDSSMGQIDELAATGNYLLTKRYNSKNNVYMIYVLDKNTGTALQSWDLGNKYYMGLCGGKEVGTCLMYNYDSSSLETRSITDGSLISSLAVPQYGYSLTYSRSLDVIYFSNGNYHTMLSSSTGTVIGSFTTADYMLLAADEASGTSWLQAAINSGSVPSKGVSNVSLTFNSDRLLPGTYKANVVFEHPLGWEPGPFTVPCQLTVLPFSKLTVTPATLDFGKVWLGKDSLSALTLQNSGNVNVTVYSVTHLNKAFTTDPTPIIVPPFSTVMLNARFTPAKSGSVKNTTIIVSNALDLPIRTVSMTGIGVAPPAIVVNPKQFSVQIPSGSSSAQTFSLENKGGAEYAFKIHATEKSQKAATGTLYVASGNQIIQLDPSTFAPIGDTISPLPDLWIRGLAYDGKYLYLAGDPEKPFKLYVVDQGNPTLVDTLITDLGGIKCTGLGVTEDYVLVLCSNYQVVYIDKNNGKTVQTIKTQGFGALTAATSRGSFFLFNPDGWNIEERSLIDGSLINQINSPDSSNLSGAGYSNAEGILFVSDFNGTIKGLNPDNGEVVSSVIRKFTNIESLAADEATFNQQWLNLSIKNGVVPAGGKLDIGVLFDAKELVPGPFTGEITVTPAVAGAPGPFIIPCTLSVSEGEMAKK